jgi:hypothetical protein
MSAGSRLATVRAIVWRRLARIRRRFLPESEASLPAPTPARPGTSPRDDGPPGSTTTVPLIVDYFGRDGSTAMMKLLSSAPEVAVSGSYPFEVDRLRAVLEAPDPLAAWEDLAARTVGAAGTAPRFYAEKMIDIRKWVMERLPVRAIVMLRDPRDTYVSIEAFSRAVGAEEIGGPGGREQRLERFIERQTERLDWIAGLDDDAMTVVRYEALAGDLEETAAVLSSWLGVTLEPAAVGSDLRLRWVHGTSASPERSIGRWRRELPDDAAGRIEDALGERMRNLGY